MIPMVSNLDRFEVLLSICAICAILTRHVVLLWKELNIGYKFRFCNSFNNIASYSPYPWIEQIEKFETPAFFLHAVWTYMLNIQVLSSSCCMNIYAEYPSPFLNLNPKHGREKLNKTLSRKNWTSVEKLSFVRKIFRLNNTRLVQRNS